MHELVFLFWTVQQQHAFPTPILIAHWCDSKLHRLFYKPKPKPKPKPNLNLNQVDLRRTAATVKEASDLKELEYHFLAGAEDDVGLRVLGVNGQH